MKTLVNPRAGSGGTIYRTRMGQMLLINRLKVAGLIDRMESEGWVQRIDDPEDRRIKLVRLTWAGRRLVDQVNPGNEKRVAEVIRERAAAAQSDLCSLPGQARTRLNPGKED